MAVMQVVLFAALCATAFAVDAKYKPCSDAGADNCDILRVHINPCIKKNGNCQLYKGTNVTLDFDFTSKFDAAELETGVYWQNLAFEGMGSSNGCDYTSCPVSTGQTQTYTYPFHVDPKLPRGAYDIKWKVWNKQDKSQLCCFTTTIKINKSKKTR